MWKDYSLSYLKNNRASCVSILAAAFLATLFLSLLCSIAYNFWIYDVEKISREEGDWQGRIVGELTEKELAVVENFANVENLVVREKRVVDLYFQNPRTIYQDMPLISAELGLGEDSLQYHSLLLSRYLIHDPGDENPPMLLTLYLAILVVMALSLILIIRNSFALSMNARIHQLGIFSSIGATPKQIRVCLLQEAAVLSIGPILAGCLSGILLSCGVLEAVNLFASQVAGRQEAVFSYHPLIFLITILSSALTVLISAWIPARKLSRMTPLESIRNAESFQLKKKKHSRFLSFLFGIEGELAGNSLRAQKKAFRISSLSLLLSFLGFSVMLAFTTLAEISTRYTYFERYQDAWDVMITAKETSILDFTLTEKLRTLSGAKEVAVYQKAEAIAVLTEEQQSEELTALGGFYAVAGKTGEESALLAEAPLVVLDDASFSAYCLQLGVEPSLDGALVLNRIWDRFNSNFRYKEYVPFVKEDAETTILTRGGQKDSALEIPVLSYTQTPPVLREEYENYALVHFLPLTLWKEIAGALGEAENDLSMRILSAGNADLADLDRLQEEAVRLIQPDYKIESENRLRERLSNDRLIEGMKVILGALCVLLAVIGIANVFSNTLGFLRQRKREFARYRSIGLTPKEMKKLFVIEAFAVAGKPLLITAPFTVLFVQFAVTASYLDPMVFWSEAPILPVLIFAASIIGFVALAYYLGGKRILQCDLNEALREDTLV